MKSFFTNLSLFLLLIQSGTILAQLPGDTTFIQTLTYQSTTRDTMISFPSFNTSNIERVWMRYAIRCKDGLVSPAVSGQTNIGCGEWDYSCNTYITDSSRIDSLNASVDKYTVFPSPAINNTYSVDPTFAIYPHLQTSISGLVTSNETGFHLASASNSNSELLSSSTYGGKLYLLINQSFLNTVGLPTGAIDAMSLFNIGTTTNIQHFKISIKEVNENSFDLIDYTNLTGFQEVLYSDYTFTNGENKFIFHQPYSWGGNNLLIEFQGYGLSNNPALDLSTIDSGYGAGFYSNDNNYGRLMEGSYVDVPSYYGITGNNPRTIETWIKTGVTNKNIAVWGSNSSGKRFTFRVDATGGLRVEISGGYVIGATNVADDNWHHVAVVFNGVDLNDISFYVDGQLDANVQISNLAVNTDNGSIVQISKGYYDRYWNGNLDDIRIWSAALDETTIQHYKNRVIDNLHPNYSALELYYRFEDQSGTVTDLSGNNRNGLFMGTPFYGSTYRNAHQYEFVTTQEIPEITFYQGNYSFNTIQNPVNDSIPLEPYIILENQYTPHPGTLLSDITAITYPMWPDSSIQYDQNEVFVQKIPVTNLSTLNNGTINYFNRIPSKIELMSFVTPYGINLDLGPDGKAWYFDVTDYLPILNGNKRISIERGGQWQEDMDISFQFVHGTPVRDVLDLRQIWKVDSRSYTDILNDTYFASRLVKLPIGTIEAKIRSAITGHGQEGEFIPRTHFMNINNGQESFNWQVWKECADNPVYPQGGTWIYDRAGWCPGKPTDIKEWDVTNQISNNEIVVDYGLNGASGTSNYIANHQIVAYGAPNFTLDARINEIHAPNDNIVNSRYNPICSLPKIVIENTGTTVIQSMEISCKVNSGGIESHSWTGNLNYLEKTEIDLAVSPNFWDAATNGTNTFSVFITSVNGGNDNYGLNDTLHSHFEIAESLPTKFVLHFKTNNVASESSYEIRDTDGNVLYQRSGMSNNTIYNDTISASTGCYILDVNDSGNDGIDFWANSDGTGYITITSISGQQLKTFEPDFGKNIHFEYMVTSESGLNELNDANKIILFPNPSSDKITLVTNKNLFNNWKIIDCYGRTVEEGIILYNDLHEFDINISALESGLYLVALENEGSSQTISFIKN